MITAELERLQRLLATREGKPGYKSNVLALQQKIAALLNDEAPQDHEFEPGPDA